MKILIDESVVRFVMDAIDGFFAAPDDEADQEAQEELLTARSKLRQALADAALDKMADNARELGLDYDQPAPAQEPVAWGNLANWCLDSDRVLITDKAEAAKYHRDVYDLTPLYTNPPAPAQPLTWQPIETAPKDGEMILVCIPRQMDLVVRARYNRIHNFWQTDYEGEGGITRPTWFHEGDLWHPIPPIHGITGSKT